MSRSKPLDSLDSAWAIESVIERDFILYTNEYAPCHAIMEAEAKNSVEKLVRY